MRRWWTKKYQTSQKSDEFNKYTFWELLIEFFEDYYASDKKRVWKDERKVKGHVRLPKTGNSLIDRWEEQLANGITPDLTEGMLPEKRAKIKDKIKALEDAQQKQQEAIEDQQMDKFFDAVSTGNDIASAYSSAAEFSDDYTNKGT